MKMWHPKDERVFERPLENKEAHPHEGDTNLGYSIMGAENVDPTAPKDLKEPFNYNNTRMPNHLWPDILGFTASALDSIYVADRLTLRTPNMFDVILNTGTTLVDAHKQPNTTRVIIPYTGPLKTNKCVLVNTVTMEL